MKADLVLTPMGLRFGQRLIPCTIGRNGVTRQKREGDGATPAGLWRIMAAYYRPDRLGGKQAWAQPIGLNDLWSDASGQPDYNHLVKAPYSASHEKMRRADPLYDLVLVTDWNWPNAKPGLGSAIFLHSWRRPGAPTAGCIAMAQPNLLWLAARIKPGATLLVPDAMSNRGRQK